MANVNFKKWLCPVIKVLDFVLHVVFRVPCPGASPSEAQTKNDSVLPNKKDDGKD